MSSYIVIGGFAIAVVASILIYWKLNVMTESQFARLWFGFLLLAVVTGAWVTLLEKQDQLSTVMLIALFYYVWFFLSTVTANEIHMDPMGVIQFN